MIAHVSFRGRYNDDKYPFDYAKVGPKQPIEYLQCYFRYNPECSVDGSWRCIAVNQSDQDNIQRGRREDKYNEKFKDRKAGTNVIVDIARRALNIVRRSPDHTLPPVDPTMPSYRRERRSGDEA